MDPTSGAAFLHCWPSRHTQLGSHTRALQSLPHMLVLFKYTWKSERFGLEYTAVPFPTERDGGIRKVLRGYTIIWLQVREDSSPESPTWVLAGHWEVGHITGFKHTEPSTGPGPGESHHLCCCWFHFGIPIASLQYAASSLIVHPFTSKSTSKLPLKWVQNVP